MLGRIEIGRPDIACPDTVCPDKYGDREDASELDLGLMGG